jgi:hypothetical protein
VEKEEKEEKEGEGTKISIDKSRRYFSEFCMELPQNRGDEHQKVQAKRKHSHWARFVYTKK